MKRLAVLTPRDTQKASFTDGCATVPKGCMTGAVHIYSEIHKIRYINIATHHVILLTFKLIIIDSFVLFITENNDTEHKVVEQILLCFVNV
jgi:hypothetical protein